jgi:hypothetical protein
MRFREFNPLLEAREDLFPYLSNELIKLGYSLDDMKRMSGTTLRLLLSTTNDAERKIVAQDIASKLGGTLERDGKDVRIAGGKIQIKSDSQQGKKSGGIDNELHLVNKINEFVKERGPLTVTFVGDNGKRISASNITEAVHVGANTKDRKKTDVQLLTQNNPIPISIKKRNAEHWESADTYFGARLDTIVDYLLAKKKITITPTGNYRKKDGVPIVRINPTVAIPATDKESVDVVFGSDILAGNGAVVKETFQDEHYTLQGNHLTITAELVITHPEDIPENLKVVWVIGNSSDRMRPLSKYPGLRPQAFYTSRVNKNMLVVDPSEITGPVPAVEKSSTTKPALKVNQTQNGSL